MRIKMAVLFWIRLDQIRPKWIKLRSNWFKSVQIGSNQINLDQIGSNWFKSYQSELNEIDWTKFDQIG